MIGRALKSRRGPGTSRTPLGRLRSALFAWIGVLAVLLQIGAGPVHRAEPRPAAADAQAALGALVAAFGPNVVLCLSEDGSGSPTHGSHDCCDDCALCHHGGQSAAVLPPSSADPVLYAAPPRPLRVALDAGVDRPRLVLSARPRGPPFSA